MFRVGLDVAPRRRRRKKKKKRNKRCEFRPPGWTLLPDAVREERSSHLGREHPLDKMGLTISTMFARLFGKKQMRILMGETSSTELTR